MKLTWQMVVDAACASLGASQSEVLTAIKTPLHPATLHDDFAKAAMQAAATNLVGAEGFTFADRAAWAYMQADAMLAERTKPK